MQFHSSKVRAGKKQFMVNLRLNHNNNDEYGDGISWRRGNILGRGSFGTVFLATTVSKYSCFPPLMAIKSAEVSNSASIQGEKQVLDNLNGCPHIIACLGEEMTFGNNGKLTYNMLLEYASGGTLSDRIRNFGTNGGLPESEVKHYTRSLLLGIKYIHDSGYVHCDLKPDNILLVRNYEENKKRASIENKLCVKISDFGFAKKGLQQGIENSRKRKAEGRYWKGTPMYLSPEAVKHCIQECPSDIWALGCIVLEMLTGEDPWDLEESDVLRILGFSRRLPKIPRKLSTDAKDFLRKCFLRNPNNRWTAAMLLNHPFTRAIEEIDVPETEIEESREQLSNHEMEKDARKRQKCSSDSVISSNFLPIKDYSDFIY